MDEATLSAPIPFSRRLMRLRNKPITKQDFSGYVVWRGFYTGAGFGLGELDPIDVGDALKKTEEELAACEKYQRILDAAVEVIAERGYFKSPVSEIAKRAGVADGTVYLYFKSKDDVLRTAIDRTFEKFYKQIADAFVTIKGPREQLEYIARVHLESSTANRSMAVLMQTEMRQSARFIAEFSHHHLVKYIQMVREVVRRGQEEGIFRRDVSDGVVAHCMFGAIDELLSSAVFTGRIYDAKATAAQVMDVLLKGITAG